MSTNIYSQVSATEKLLPVSVLSPGAYTWTAPGTFGDLLAFRDTVLLSFIDVTDASAVDNQGDWLGKLDGSNNPLPSLKAIYRDKNSGYAELGDILIAAVLYNPLTTWSQFQYNGYVSGRYANYSTFGQTNFLPEAILYIGTYAGSLAASLKAGWSSSTPSTPTGPFSYIICKKDAVAEHYITDKMHGSSLFDGEDTHAPLSDMCAFGWSVATPAAFAEMRSFLSNRLSEHVSIPSVSIRPRAADNRKSPGNPAHIHQSSASPFTVAFSEKTLGASQASRFLFSPLALASVGILASRWPARSAPGEWTKGTKESHDLVVDCSTPPSGTAMAFSTDPALVDASQKPFTGSESFILDSSSDTPTIRIAISYAATSHILTDDLDPPDAPWGVFDLDVEVRTDYPSQYQPTGRIIGPAGFGVSGVMALDFQDHAVTALAVTGLAGIDIPRGAYTVVVDRYVNNAGVVCPSSARSFVLSDSASPYVPHPGQLEGWGYFPREEGLPTVSPASPSAIGIAWTLEPGSSGAVSAGSGSLLSISSSPMFRRRYRRPYPAAFDSAGITGKAPGNARYFIEAGLSANAATPGPGLAAFDATGAACLLRDTGVGMDIVNGPFRACLRLVERSHDSGATWKKSVGLPLFPSDCGLAAWAFGPDADWSQPRIYRLEVRKNGTTFKCFLSDKVADSPLALVDSGISIPLSALPLSDTLSPREPLAVDQAEAIFGAAAANGYASVSSTWEYARYGFLDQAFDAFVQTDDKLGIWKAQNALDASAFRRSVDILIGDPLLSGAATADPNTSGSTITRVRISAAALPALPAPLPQPPIPYKLRLFSLDWNEVHETDTAGFFPSGFPGYATSGFSFIESHADLADPSTPALVPSSGSTWTFNLNQTNRKRRFALFAAIDSPLSTEPALLPARLISDMLQADPPGAGTRRNDCRYAARQFLPDFYVRDTMSDTGQSPGSSLSPDLALAVYRGNTLPDPQLTAETTYPWGFAKGDPMPYDYSPDGVITIESSDAAKPIKLTDSGWTDYDATNCYYNRMWMRVSNRGIVPGPARSQIFFLGSALRAAFDPYGTDARNDDYEKIYANAALTSYVQTKYQLYNPSVRAKPTMVDAIPALSGASDPATLKGYAIAEFVWHVPASALPTSPGDAHGCRTACVNVPNTSSHPDFSTGIDEASLPATIDSVWSADRHDNNIAVRNSNIVQGRLPDGTENATVTQKIKVKDYTPVNYSRLPNDFTLSFSKRYAIWGLSLDARRFPKGAAVLRVPARLCTSVTLKDCEELFQGKAEKPLLAGNNLFDLKKPGAFQPKPQGGEYRLFVIAGGTLGHILGLSPVILANRKQRVLSSAVDIFYLAEPKTTPGRYSLELAQTANGKTVGSFRTTIDFLPDKKIAFVADRRTGAIYDVKKNPEVFQAIPYTELVPFAAPDLAVQEGFRFAKADAALFLAGKLGGQIANLHRDFKADHIDNVIGTMPGGIAAVIVGRLIGRDGMGLAGHTVLADLGLTGIPTMESRCDDSGYYMLRIPEKALLASSTHRGSITVSIHAYSTGKRIRALVKRRYGVGDMHFANPPIIVR